MSVQELTALVGRLEAVATRLEASAGGAAGGAGEADGASSASVKAYDQFLTNSVAPYSALSKQLGGDVAVQATEVEAAFATQRAFLVTAAESKAPKPDMLQKLLKPTSEKVSAVQAIADKSKSRDETNHLKSVSEAIAALGWVTVVKPGAYISETMESATFYINRVLVNYREKENHAPWAKSVKKMWTDLCDYVKDFHSTGVTWNPNGRDAVDSPAAAAAPAPPAPAPAGAPPPPPPAPPIDPDFLKKAMEEEKSGSDSKAALFADLNKGGAVTAGLRKVTDDMKTHKNPALRAGPAPFKKPAPGPKPAPSPKPAPKPVVQTKPPNLELQGKRWMVEYQKDNNELCISDTELKQTIYVFKCERSTVQVKGKVNSIILDNCKKVAVVFDDVISGLEFVNCQSVKGQAMGRCPTVSIEKTDGCQVYLSQESKEAEIVTAKSSEMNILFPQADGDFIEVPVPEQFKSKFNTKTNKLETSMTEAAA